MLALTKGWDRDQVRQIVRETLLETIEPIIYDEALELMEPHRRPVTASTSCPRRPRRSCSPSPSCSASTGPSRRAVRSTRTGATRAEMAFYAYGARRPTPCATLAERTGIDLARVERLLRLGDRSPDARGGRPPGRRQRRPPAGSDRPRARLGGPPVHEAGPAARSGRRTDARSSRTGLAVGRALRCCLARPAGRALPVHAAWTLACRLGVRGPWPDLMQSLARPAAAEHGRAQAHEQRQQRSQRQHGGAASQARRC